MFEKAKLVGTPLVRLGTKTQVGNGNEVIR